MLHNSEPDFWLQIFEALQLDPAQCRLLLTEVIDDPHTMCYKIQDEQGVSVPPCTATRSFST